MRRPLVIGAVFLLITVLMGPAATQAQKAYPIPKTLTLQYATLPIWIDASVAVTENGEPDPAVWGEYAGRLREILTTPADNPVHIGDQIVYLNKPSEPGCRDVGPAFVDYPDPPPRGTLEDAIKHSDVALLARVTDRAYGFYSGVPGQLLQIEPSRWYGMALTQPRYYFFVPTGRFRIAGVKICKTDQRYAPAPDIGDEVFLFVFGPADTTGVLFHVFDAGDIVPVAPDGSLRLPPQYITAGDQNASRASTLSKRDLLDQIQGLRRPPA